MKKNDIFLIIVVFIIALFGWIFFVLLGKETGGIVRVEVDGKLYGTFSLEEEQEIRIHDTNVLVIKDGVVDMTEADCPDQICVEHRTIKNNGETIVCLPNKVIVTIVNGSEGELDAIAN